MNLLKFILKHRFPYRLLILLSSLIATVFGLLSPFFQKTFVDQFANFTPEELIHWVHLNPLISAFGCMLGFQLLSQATNWLGMREALILQRLLADKIYRKNLSLKSDTLAKRTVGETVSLYTTDVSGATFLLEQTIPMGFATVFPLILAPFAISWMFKVPIWPTFLAILTISILNTYMAFRQSRFFFLFKHLATERIAIVNEWIQNLRVIRILGWTEEFEKRILVKRILETKNRVQMVTNGQFMNAVATTVTFAINIVAIVSLLKLRASPPTPGELLALLWILGVFLIRPFRQMPWFFTFAFDAWTSIRRLEDYLEIENPPSSFDSLKRESSAPNISNANKALEIRGLNLKVGQHTILKNISFNINAGEFVAIVGEVGSGKTMFLLSLLGETSAHFESYNLFNFQVIDMSWLHFRSIFSFVPQEGFIMSSTLRDNIFFEYRSSVEHDSSVMNALSKSDFNVERERSGDGLNTIIGERGVNLSGGQRQRVSIARADFKKADIVLLDDTFSAVDVGTEKRIINKMIRSEWKGKTIILTTHRMSVLPNCDRILFMKDGEFVDQGTYADLLKNNLEFAHFVLEKEKEKNENA